MAHVEVTAMGERDPVVRDAENFRFSFLASAVEAILSQRAGHALTDEDLRKLGLAREWLSEVTDGAGLVAKGRPGAVSARRSVGALVYALDTLEAMALIRTEDELLERLRGMLAAVDTSIREKRIAGDQQGLREAHTFFHALNQSVLSDIKHRSANRVMPPVSPLK